MWDRDMIDQVVETTSSVILGIGTIAAAVITAYLMVKNKLDKKGEEVAKPIESRNGGTVELVQGQAFSASDPSFVSYLIQNSAEIPELRREIQILAGRLQKALLRLAENDIEYEDI